MKVLSPTLEERIQQLGRQLLEHISGQTGTERRVWLDSLISRAIEDKDFRVQTLRFVDVLPTLQNDADLVSHLKEYFDGIEQTRYPDAAASRRLL